MFQTDRLRELASFRSDHFSLTSFYWKVPPASDRAHRGEEILIQGLLKEARAQIEGQNHPRERARSAQADRKKILDYFRSQPGALQTNMALFSCAGESFWQAVKLPRGVCAGLFLSDSFYLQPLTVLLDEHHRYCTVLVDRQLARILEIYMGEIEEHTALLDDVPGRIKAATWTGGNERQIERRIENKAHQHYKRTATLLSQFFRKYHFDWLLLGGHPGGLAAFENHLHSSLRSRRIGTFATDVKSATWQEILAKSMEIAEARARQEKSLLVEEILNKANQGGLGVTGLEGTLRALERGEVHTLVLDEDLQAPAWRCGQCGFVTSLELQGCPVCGGGVQQLESATERVVEMAIQDGSQIRFVSGNVLWQQAGSIGALLRFRTAESEQQSA